MYYYQMDPNEPRQSYAELVRSREQERVAHHAAHSSRSTRPTTHRRASWLEFVQTVSFARIVK